MSFEEKSTWAVMAALILTYGGYYYDVFVTQGGIMYEGYQARMIGMVVLLIVLLIIGHIAIAVFEPDGAGDSDERDRTINYFGEYVGGFALGGVTLAVLGMAMLEIPHFYIAHALLGGLVLSELVAGLAKIWRYRRGF